MIIDNGTQRTLVVPGIHDGTCGEAAGQLAFVPNIATPKSDVVKGGTLDGEPVLLSIAKPPRGTRFCTATWRRPA